MQTLAETPSHRPLIPAIGVAASALVLFGFQLPGWGHLLLVAAVGLAWAMDRELGADLTLIGIGIAIVSSTSVEADVSWPSFIRIGAVLGLAVATPFLLDRLLLRRKAITFPWRSRTRKTRLEIAYLVAVPVLGWLILPFYFIRSGTYANWPHITETDELVRFFIGVNAVGTWDELFFICTCFALLRRHLPLWPANFVQATIFVSFLWELGYRSWGPFLTAPFALLQGYLFARTKSLGYVLAVHLLFDAIVFLAIVHAHNPDWIPIFVY
ncbi:type II CAAX prenyl endopeptidase Rce1 family protein [Homoserinibacter sp. GY 40078]|uniref:CPBP family glutamic-type intramembrane protease n=1 Tax=Homoserinibacter sp. GY 40078 TaxID=2603275 RepID=UPI0011C87031|nr:CPBP family glutamic-type intramembrane protease [Homoserinibacter sp. GY 40078]TXK17346.1 CPBP family intramembrane metalloprotease [Homoserinibacter sp. GY 40078]